MPNTDENLIEKNLSDDDRSDRAPPNLADYQQTCNDFDWQQQPLTQLKTMPQGGVNIAYTAIDSHVAAGRGDKLALRWLAKDDSIRELSYADLAAASGRFASVLSKLGITRGDRVYSLAGRTPELYVAALGTLRAGCVFTPLFSAFGPEPIRSRMEIGQANVLITSSRLYKKKVRAWWRELSHIKAVILLDDQLADEEGCYTLSELLTDAAADFPCVAMEPEDMALLHFTSGTTGKPKGVVHVHAAVQHHIASAYFALDLHPDDIYWCTADPGWVTGTSYGIIAPLCLGVTMIVDEAEFDVERWYRILQDHQVNVWYTAPTAIRMLMKAGGEQAQQFDLSSLRFLASVGEPLNPEAVHWGLHYLGLPFHDNWWQTETGGIMIANFASQAIKPGSMGLPLPGIKAGIVQRTPTGDVEDNLPPMTIGELAIKPPWPSMFRGYLGQDEKYRRCFVGGWYFSGDLAMRDQDGYFWFVGRADDLIKSSGHLIGPFEVESTLMEHEAVAEVGVIGKPDDIAGEIVKAFVALKPGFEGNDELNKALLGLARKKLGSAVAPKEIVFRQNLPKTRSGKIMRRLLKARELGLPEGDISTLESDEQ